ncbi:unnamed protein product [Phaedon cochleariae]|uniref:Uncharacterized protein n=1 Tax=Phaedon cochleariae TaxID=80249 RepID=A0A9N9X5K8_PHACE|nr:unnamed protein product [Phaedon cochleariae]
MGWKEYFQKLTVLEKVLIISVAILCIVVVVLFIGFLATHDDDVCTHPECVRAAVHILDTVDPLANPCEDFYRFACGTFLQNAFTTGRPSLLHELSELTKNQLQEIVVETRKDETELPRMLRAQRRFYRACANTSAIEEEENQTVLRLLDEVLGGWPLLKRQMWDDRGFDWVKSTIKSRKLGLYYQFFFSVDVYHNLTNNKDMLWIRPPAQIEISSFQWKEETIDLMADIATLLGSESNVIPEIRTTMYFAKQIQGLAEIYHNKSLPYGSSERQNRTIASINHKYIKIDWLSFLKNITGLPLREDDPVMFDLTDYLTDFHYLLHRTPKRIRANFMSWAIISSNINYMTREVRDKYKELSKFSNDTEEADTSRCDICFKLSTGLFRSIAESEYMRRYTTIEKKTSISRMIQAIKKEMEISLTITPWLDEVSRNNALKRLENITEAIGWLDLAFDIDKIDQINGYHKIVVHGDNAVDMARTMTRSNFDNYYRQMERNITDLDRISSPRIEVNAYFVRSYNILVLPASILQGQIFSTNRPSYLNYGALGTVIGHEMTHGFSEAGELFDSDSDNLWTNETMQRFANVSRCLVDEYDNYREGIGTLEVNDTSYPLQTLLDENLADFTGVNLAYTAYRRWAQLNAPEKTLPGVRFTPNQLFWIMASTYMCHDRKLSEDDTFFKGRDASHGEPEFRVVGRIRNSPYFAKDFDCPADSEMNVKDKCRVYY